MTEVSEVWYGNDLSLFLKPGSIKLGYIYGNNRCLVGISALQMRFHVIIMKIKVHLELEVLCLFVILVTGSNLGVVFSEVRVRFIYTYVPRYPRL